MALPAQGTAQGEHRVPADNGHAEELLPPADDERYAVGSRRLVHHEDEGLHSKGRHRRGEMDKGRQTRHPDAVHVQQRLCGTLCKLHIKQTPSRNVQATPFGLHGVRGFNAVQRRTEGQQGATGGTTGEKQPKDEKKPITRFRKFLSADFRIIYNNVEKIVEVLLFCKIITNFAA